MGNRKGPQAAEISRLLGQNVVAFRGRVGLSQEGTADRAGLHRTEIAYIEGGKRLPRLDTIVKIAGGGRSGALRVVDGDRLEARLTAGGGGTEMSDQEKEWTLAKRFGANVAWFRHGAGLS
jgi:transcriptional regulator with XRE-family HTH domain